MHYCIILTNTIKYMKSFLQQPKTLIFITHYNHNFSLTNIVLYRYKLKRLDLTDSILTLDKMECNKYVTRNHNS